MIPGILPGFLSRSTRCRLRSGEGGNELGEYRIVKVVIRKGASQFVAVFFWEPAEIFHGIFVVSLSCTDIFS